MKTVESNFVFFPLEKDVMYKWKKFQQGLMEELKRMTNNPLFLILMGYLGLDLLKSFLLLSLSKNFHHCIASFFSIGKSIPSCNSDVHVKEKCAVEFQKLLFNRWNDEAS